MGGTSLKRARSIRPSEITAPEVYGDRRRLLALLGASAFSSTFPRRGIAQASATRNETLSIKDTPNTFEDITRYNNYYEFGLDKTDPKAKSQGFRTRPWTVKVAGEAEVLGDFDLDDVLRPHALEERVYRLRCVEAWSMVVPWMGVSLADVLKRYRPTSKAKFVEFTTAYDPRQMPGQRTRVLDWPYVEGLRIDEAMHPLAMLVTGVYGRMLPTQNGAPLRLVVPWKYGFKSIKAIVKIRFAERQPRNTWQLAAPGEYGFYANVNPAVDHPRWSQATERRIGSGFFATRIPTFPFNGYAVDVADLYRGMNLQHYF